MREKIIRTAIISIDPIMAFEFYNSLKFSTHIDLFIIDYETDIGSSLSKKKEYACLVKSFDELKYKLSELLIELVFIAEQEDDHPIFKQLKKTRLILGNYNMLDFDDFSKISSDFFKNNELLQLFDEENDFNQLSRMENKFNNKPYKIIIDCFKDINDKIIYLDSVLFFKTSENELFFQKDLGNYSLLNKIKYFFTKLKFKNIISLKIEVIESIISIKAIGCHKGWKFYRAMGINIPLLCIQNVLQRNVKIYPIINRSKIRWVQNDNIYIYFNLDVLFVDLDDTLIIRKKVVNCLINLIEKINSFNKKVVLVTRHKNDVFKTLKSFSINKQFFNGIIKVDNDEMKSNLINAYLEKNKEDKIAIFIDNEFPERIDVFKNCDIPVFDVNGIDFIRLQY